MPRRLFPVPWPAYSTRCGRPLRPLTGLTPFRRPRQTHQAFGLVGFNCFTLGRSRFRFGNCITRRMLSRGNRLVFQKKATCRPQSFLDDFYQLHRTIIPNPKLLPLPRNSFPYWSGKACFFCERASGFSFSGFAILANYKRQMGKGKKSMRQLQPWIISSILFSDRRFKKDLIEHPRRQRVHVR